jgi:glycosyltransferase involved in cell wall biosynthesis
MSSTENRCYTLTKRALIVHALFDVIGGDELLALRVAQALIEAGFEVEVLTATPVSSEKLYNVFGELKLPRITVKRVREAEFLSEIIPGRLVRLRRLVVYRKYMPIINRARREYDLVFDTQSNIPTPADIVYIHYPAVLEITSIKRRGVHWRIYNYLVKLIARKFKIPRSGRILTNSTWTANRVYKAHGVIADVLYPPVDVEYFSEVSNSGEREDIIVTVSRFTPEKELSKLLVLANELKDYRFVIAGTTGPGSERVLEELRAEKESRSLVNVEFKPNISRRELRELYSRAKFYLHPEFPEHFGIAVVEAMAAGLVPIVYHDGGAWYDVVSRVSELLGYSNIGEVPGIIRRLERDKVIYLKLRERGIMLAKIFNYENFKKNLLEKVNYVLKVKKLGEY